MVELLQTVGATIAILVGIRSIFQSRKIDELQTELTKTEGSVTISGTVHVEGGFDFIESGR